MTSQVETPGEPKSWKKLLLETGASAVQSFAPIKEINLHLCGFALYYDDPKRQVWIHHYAHWINDDVAQCAVYDGEDANARLIGIEYVISSKLFETLPTEEQKMWHSHAYDCKCGSFIAPRLPNAVEHPVVKELANTYGKTWVLWQTDRSDKLPMGEAKLMGVATKDGVWDKSLFQKRDAYYGYSTEKIVKQREDIAAASVNPNADSWQCSNPLKFEMKSGH